MITVAKTLLVAEKYLGCLLLIFVSTLSTWGVGLAARKSSLSVTYHAEVVGRETTRVSRPVAPSEDNFESGPLLKLIDPPRNSSFDTCRRDPNGRSVPLRPLALLYAWLRVVARFWPSFCRPRATFTRDVCHVGDTEGMVFNRHSTNAGRRNIWTHTLTRLVPRPICAAYHGVSSNVSGPWSSFGRETSLRDLTETMKASGFPYFRLANSPKDFGLLKPSEAYQSGQNMVSFPFSLPSTCLAEKGSKTPGVGLSKMCAEVTPFGLWGF